MSGLRLVALAVALTAALVRDGDVYVKQGRFWYDEFDRVTSC